MLNEGSRVNGHITFHSTHMEYSEESYPQRPETDNGCLEVGEEGNGE